METLITRAEPLRRVWQSWAGERSESVARGLVVAAGGLLVLDSAGTLHFGYTITISYLLIALAIAFGAPQVVRRWRELPRIVRHLAIALLAVYLLAAMVGHQETLPSSARASSQRGYVYLADLTAGLTSMLLIPSLFARRPVTPIVVAIASAGGIAGAYGLYQWLALRFGLPLNNLNNTLNSSGFGNSASQGVGLFGTPRVRGTFLEPHFLAAFLASTLPLQVWVIHRSRAGRRVAASLGTGCALASLLLADSPPAIGMLVIGALTASMLTFVARGRVLRSIIFAVAALGAWLAVIPAIADPGLFTPLTARTATTIDLTTAFRTRTWGMAVQIWAGRPILGYGPGQSAVRLAYATAAPGAPQTLVASQGVWASALVDVGVVGLGLWLYLLVGVLLRGATAALRSPDFVRGAILASAIGVTIAALTAGDRLVPGQWLILGLLLATSGSQTRDDARHGNEQADQGSQAGSQGG